MLIVGMEGREEVLRGRRRLDASRGKSLLLDEILKNWLNG